MELWGGVECTVNRVGDRYRDQVRLTGHHDRIGDLAMVAELGVRAVRMPLVWERVAPDAPDRQDWGWCDERLAEARRLGLRPIAGLLHHGSGPAYTSLVADDFVPLFAAYAGAAAARYPWIRDWTPINEPVTTARFSALYGTWYPHARDTRLFWLALLNQIEATIAAMAAIRRSVSDARLIQTDDLGEAFGDEAVAPVVAYYNHRRWLGWDLLAGRVTRDHALWEEGAALGFADRLAAIADAPCAPDIVGINHYPTSDRVLLSSGEGRGDPDAPPFDDLAALRVLDPPPGGVEAALRQAWARYGRPLAITECHLGCTREEQLRWFRRTWDTALSLRAEGVDVRAVTPWALLGNFDWTSLLTEEADVYESGAFDVRGAAPRPTALARLIGAVGADRPCPPALHELAATPGWWEREARLEAAPTAQSAPRPQACVSLGGDARPILITGASGTLGRAVAGACRLRGLAHVAADRATLAIDDREAVARLLDAVRPWAVVNTAGWVRVDDAEDSAAECLRANAHGAAVLASACEERGVHCAVFSSDLVFGNEGPDLHDEHAPVAPLGAYGRSKAAMEASVGPLTRTLLVRTAAFFSPFDTANFAMAVEAQLRAGQVFHASASHHVTPTYVPDLVLATLDLVIDHETGLWNLTHEEPVSWLAFGRRIATARGLDPALLVAANPDVLGWRAQRPLRAGLRSARGRLLPTLDQAVATYAAERRRHGTSLAHSAATA